VGSEEKAGFVQDLGAERVIVGDAEAVAREAPALRPTVVLDPLGGAFTGVAIEALAPHGRLVLYGTSADVQGAVPLQQLYRKGLTVFGYGGLIEPDEVVRACLRNALEALSRGGLDVVVDSVLPLERVNEAFERLVARQVKGKLLLDTTS
jgi:NADPH2:quinone reductase